MEYPPTIMDTAHNHSIDEKAFIYMVMPFQIITGNNGNNDSTEGDLFDEVNSQPHNVNASDLLQQLKEWSVQNTKSSTLPGDFSKYYGFMKNHFGYDENSELIVFQLETSKLKPASGFETFKNMQAQFSKGAWLGQSDIRMNGMAEIRVLINPTAGIGFFILGFECFSFEKNLADSLAQIDFFRNIGWRRNQKPSDKQTQKHAWIFEKDSDSGMTIYQMLQCYFADLSNWIRFYQDRATVLYTFASVKLGSKANEELCEQAYEIIRVPDRNSPRFDQSLTEPIIHRVGRNVAFTALNEGALITETINDSMNTKAIANKYFPSFILALNQRELLLNNMHFIAQLNTLDLKSLNGDSFDKMETLRSRLLILHLKQIFYSVSNLHEVELFFNQLQKAFAIENMLLENEECVREMFNLLEVQRNKELEQIEKVKSELDERRSNIINTILGAIGCLGLFSFLKDVIPFYEDDITYQAWYRLLSICLPILIMAYIIKLVFYSRK
jgi:hypothetical protein